MDPELFLKEFLAKWDQPRAWLGVSSLEGLARLKGQHDVVNWVREYFAEKRDAE